MREPLSHTRRIGGARTARAVGLALLCVGGSAVAQESAAKWLADMEQALSARNYVGVFVHQQRGRSETLQIVHRAGPRNSEERLLSLDGSGREFVRRGGELTCYLPDERLVVVEPAHDSGLLFAELRKLDIGETGPYRLSELPATRVGEREVRVVDIEPRDRFRYGYRLWIDAKSAMPLKTQLRTSQGEVVEQMLFTELRLPRRIADADLLAQTDASGFRWARHAAPVVTPASPAQAAAAWQASDLPPGFRMTLRSQQEMPGSQGPVTQWVFSDGLATVSVFVEQEPAGEDRSQGAEASSARADAAAVTQMGSSSAYSTTRQGWRVTAIGEVPPDTVRAIAGSLTAPASAAFAGSGPGRR